jgi:hypothetical protein
MTGVYLHLATNHIPVLGMILGFVILAIGFVWQSEDLKKFSMGFFVALGLIVWMVYLTGEPAEDAVKSLSGVAQDAIESHEDAAIFALVGVELVAALSLTGLILLKRGIVLRSWFPKVLIGMVFMTGLILVRVATLGGKIRHSEIDGIPTQIQGQ